MSEKYSLDWFLDRLDPRDFKDLDWASLGQASVNAMIGKNGGTVNEDLNYAMADARHWHQGYLKMVDAYQDVTRKLGAMQDSLTISNEYTEELESTINELNQPLTSDHPAIVDAEKAGYERGWDSAVEEFKPEIERLKAELSFERTTFVNDDNWTIHNLEVEKEELLRNIEHLKQILEETREEQQNNIRIYSGYIHDRDDIIQDLTNRLRVMENKKNRWRDLTLECIKDILDEAIDEGFSL